MGVLRKLIPTCNDILGDRTSCPHYAGGSIFPPDEGPERMLKARRLGWCCVYILSTPPDPSEPLYIVLSLGRLMCLDYINGLCSLVSGWAWPMVKGQGGGVGSPQAGCVSHLYSFQGDFYVSFLFGFQ